MDLPYGATGVFVNEFSADKGKLYTLFNANYRSASGVTLRIPCNKPVASVCDVLGNTLPAKVKDGFLEIECPISPRGVNGAVVAF